MKLEKERLALEAENARRELQLQSAALVTLTELEYENLLRDKSPSTQETRTER